MLKDRLAKALEERPELTQAGLARACKIKPPSVSGWFSGATQALKGANLLNAAAYLGVRPQWLATGRAPMRPGAGREQEIVSGAESSGETPAGNYRAEQLDAQGSMGSEGVVNEDYPEVIRAVDFADNYIRSLMGFLPPPGRLKLMTGIGNSMVPQINPGETVLVDVACNEFRGDGIYLINSGGGQQLKTLQDRGDAIYVVSTNAAVYPPFPMAPGTIIGGRAYLINRIERLL